MNIWSSLAIVVLLFLMALLGVQYPLLFGVIVPYAAVTIFIIGIIYRVIKWARSPVPFRWPTTAGQQKSLPWIKANNLESPHNIWGVFGRMILEIFLFRSLFRNTKVELRDGSRVLYGSEKFLWLGAMVFHWSFLIILLRHFRFFTEPVIGFVYWLQSIDGLFEIAVPTLFISNILIVVALLYLLARRFFNPQVRYISLFTDYFALFLLLAIVISGIWMRYLDKVDIIKVKELAMGLVSFSPITPEGIGSIFYIHLFFVSILIMYFPFSKLMHMAGVFFSPTRNLANTNRVKRHINPWNPKVKVHTYEEYEDEFRDIMKSVGLPLDKE
jgi:nitrate reductase gamma subunit